MTASADLLEQLSIEDYATLAFSLEASAPNGFGEGGVYAGPLETGTNGQAWHSAFRVPGEMISARARLLRVAPGKVFVRWAKSNTLGSWKSGAAGAWWVTDNMADHIVDQTAARFGRRGDSSLVARQYAQVKEDWSDMGAVVVCRTTRPIKVLVGVGRPVAGVPNVVSGMTDELQVVILTTIASAKDRGRRTFIGDQIMTNLWSGSSSAFTDYWLRAQIVSRRRTAQRIAHRGR